MLQKPSRRQNRDIRKYIIAEGRVALGIGEFIRNKLRCQKTRWRKKEIYTQNLKEKKKSMRIYFLQFFKNYLLTPESNKNRSQ